jgi:outer membrane cobalamin receptor
MTNFSRVFEPSSRLPIALAIVAAVAWPSKAHGQSGDLRTATLEDLMKITVTTASRRAEDVGDAPAQVEVVTARQIQQRGYQSLSDLLRDQPGIKLDAGTDPDYPADITVQGTRSTSRVVLLLDGIRVTSPTGEPLPIMANYPVHNARQVEIVFGPASALYGADAFSAVINIITKNAQDEAGFTASASTGQFGMTNQTARYARRIGENGSFTVSGQRYRDSQANLSAYYPELFEGMQAQRSGVFNSIFGPMTSASPVSTGFETPLAAHSVHAALKLGAVQASLFTSRQRASTSAPYTPDNAVYNAAAFQQNDLTVASGSYLRAFGAATGTSIVTYSRHRLSPQSGYWNVFSNFQKSFKYAYGSMLKGEQQLTWRLSSRTTMTAGATAERFFAIPQGADLNEPIRSHEVPGTILGTAIVDDFVTMRYSNVGAYLQAQYVPVRQVAFTLGSRADYNSRYGGTFNPRMGVVLKPRAGTTMKLLFGTAYLAPSPYQASLHFGSFYSADGGQTYASDFWHLGNPDLKPQKKYTLQGTVTQSLGSLVSVSATAYLSHIKDVIRHDDADQAGPGLYHGWPVAYIEFPVNDGHEDIYGGMLDAIVLKSWSPTRRLQARAGVSFVDGSVSNNTTGELPLGAVAPVQLHASGDVELGFWTGSAALMQFGRQRVLAVASDGVSRQTLPGFAIVDVNFRRNRVTRHLNAFLRIENLFDARYVHINERAYTNPEELAGAPQGPRRITVGFDVQVGK